MITILSIGWNAKRQKLFITYMDDGVKKEIHKPQNTPSINVDEIIKNIKEKKRKSTPKITTLKESKA